MRVFLRTRASVAALPAASVDACHAALDAAWVHLGEAAGYPTPAIAAVTRLAGILNGVDYERDGLTTRKMGLEGKSVDEIRAYATGADRAEASTRTARP